MLVVLKLGGSVLTDKKVEDSFRGEIATRLANEIVGARVSNDFQLVLVHGAGSYGHIPAKKYGLVAGASGDFETAQKVNLKMTELGGLIVGKLKEAGIDSKVIHPATMVDGENILSMSIKDVKMCLDLGVIPVVGGSVAEDLSGGFKVLSGDTITSYLATVMKTDLVIVGSDIDGVYSGNPNVSKEAKLIPEISFRNVNEFDIGGSAGVDVSGGMRKKVDELLELTKHGISSRIINLNRVGILKDALGGKEVVGTKIVP